MCQLLVRTLVRLEKQRLETTKMTKNTKKTEQLREPKRAKDVSTEWRTCMVYTWSPPMNCWVKQNYRETIKPGESCRHREIKIAQENGYDWHEVVLSPCLDAE